MKPRRGTIALMMVVGVCGLSHIAVAQRGASENRPVSNRCAGRNSSDIAAVRAADRGAPYLSLCDGRALTTGNASSFAENGQAQPLTLAAGDFDGDGVPDLVSGFAAGNGGTVTVHRGNVNALWPYGAALRNGPPPAFLAGARAFTLPEAPDFIATGDFDADGHWDIVTAHRGSAALYFLRGDGRGGFAAPKRVPLAGNATAMVSGEINRTDGLADLIVAVNTANGPRALVFESPSGAITAQPEIFKLPNPATSLTLGRFSGGGMNDLAIAAGNQVVVVHARDRKLSLDQARRARVAPARITRQTFPFAIEALVAGDFTGTGPSLAALGDDGSLHILGHTVAGAGLGALLDPDFRPSFQAAKLGPDGKPVVVTGAMTPGMAARLAAMRQEAMAAPSSAEWTERSAIALPAGFAQAIPRLVAARLSGSIEQDIVAVDGGNSKIHVFSTVSDAGKLQGP